MKYESMHISFDKEEYLTCIDYTIHIRIKFIVVDVYKSYRRKKKRIITKLSACQGEYSKQRGPQHLSASRYTTKLTPKPATPIKFAVGIIPTYAIRQDRKFYCGFYENTKYL